MNFLDAAYIVLKEAGSPLHYTEITRRALQAKILDTKGQTPEATMGSRLYVDTKKPDSQFKRVNGNMFALAGRQPSEISDRISDINRQTREELHSRIMKMPADRFEALTGQLLIALGFDEEKIQVTSYSGDKGIDIRGVLNAGHITEVNAAVQVKRWQKNVQSPSIQNLRGSLAVHEQGIFITAGGFSKGAIQEAQSLGKVRISLVDGNKLLDLLITHGIGVKAEQHTILSLDYEWWNGILGNAHTEENTTDITSVSTISGNDDTDKQISISFPVDVQAHAHGKIFSGEMLDSSGTIRTGGVEYGSPSKAGQAVTGWKSCNGWSVWRYFHADTNEWRSISELRR